MPEVLREENGKPSTTRLVLILCLLLGTVVFMYVGWRIGFAGESYDQYAGLIDEWRSFLVWIGIVPYGTNKVAGALKKEPAS